MTVAQLGAPNLKVPKVVFQCRSYGGDRKFRAGDACGFDVHAAAVAENLTWEMARQMHASGLVEIGAHTVSHCVLANEADDVVRSELIRGREALESRLGVAVRHFAYPFGGRAQAGAREMLLARQAGFATAVTGAVTAELLRTCDQVVLNVRSDNPPALNAYRRLGYQEHVRFEERLVHRIGSPWPAFAAPFRRLFNRKETNA